MLVVVKLVVKTQRRLIYITLRGSYTMRRWQSDKQRKRVMALLKERGGVLSIPETESGRFAHWYSPPKVGLRGKLKAKLLRRGPEDPDWLVRAEKEEKDRQKDREKGEKPMGPPGEAVQPGQAQSTEEEP